MTTDSPAGVLAGLRQHRAAAEAHEVAILETAATWADLHPPESVHDAAYVYGTEGEVAIAGEGVPLVAEFACAELAGALGIPTEWGTRLMGDALELRHRLPRLWARTTGGDLPVWRARRIAQSTRPLSRAAAAWVDAQVAPVAHRIGPAQTDRLVEAAVARFDPERAEEARRTASERRFFEVDHRQVALDGTSRVYGELDLADALDLDAAVAAGATRLAALGSTDPLDVRRAVAVGELARRELSLDLTPEDETSEKRTQPTARRRRRSPGQQVVVYVHLSESALVGPGGVARVENAGGVRLVTAEQVRTWCGRSDTDVEVKPVIDLTSHVSVDAYEVPDQLDERVGLVHPSCVFPGARGRREAATRITACHTSARARRATAISRPCAASTTGSRPTAAGRSPGSTRPRCSGAHRTVSRSSVTTPAPATCRRVRPATRRVTESLAHTPRGAVGRGASGLSALQGQAGSS